METLLSVENLGKFYSSGKLVFSQKVRTTALDDVSFRLRKGEVLAVVGESGSGKTTLGKLVVKIDEPTSGAIFFKGKNITQMNEGQFRCYRPQIQMILQNPFDALNPKQTVFKNLQGAIFQHGFSRDKKEAWYYAKALLGDCGLTENFLSHYPGQLSGGQLQRISIARALSTQPELIIADEIVTALDVSVQSQILDLLLNLKNKRKLSMLFISHDLAVVRKVADRVIVLKNGKIEEESRTSALFKHPKTPYGKALVDTMIPFPF